MQVVETLRQFLDPGKKRIPMYMSIEKLLADSGVTAENVTPDIVVTTMLTIVDQAQGMPNPDDMKSYVFEFVRLIESINPSISWSDVIVATDSDFLQLNEDQTTNFVNLLWHIVQQVFHENGHPLPMNIIYGEQNSWQNARIQLGLLGHIISGKSPFKLTNYHPCDLVVHESRPHDSVDEQGAENWRVLQLHRTFLRMADEHPSLSEVVRSVYLMDNKVSLEYSALAIFQLHEQLTPFRKQILQDLLLRIMNRNVPFQAAQSVQKIPEALSYGWCKSPIDIRPSYQEFIKEYYVAFYEMADLHTKHSRLSKILECAQELKSFPDMFSIRSYPFVIDFACLASRRQYLKFAKWVEDSLNKYGETMAIELFKFAKDRLDVNVCLDELKAPYKIAHEDILTIGQALSEYCISEKIQIEGFREELQDFLNKVLDSSMGGKGELRKAEIQNELRRIAATTKATETAMRAELDDIIQNLASYSEGENEEKILVANAVRDTLINELTNLERFDPPKVKVLSESILLMVKHQLISTESGRKIVKYLEPLGPACQQLADDITVLLKQVERPDADDTQKIMFCLNNLSKSAVSEYAEKIRPIAEEYHLWIARHLVQTRLDTEKFIPLYVALVDEINLKIFTDSVYNETVALIRHMFMQRKSMVKMQTRTALKHLGLFLGLITLAKNKPISAADLDLRALLIESHHKGIVEMMHAVPFVVRVLRNCNESRVFRCSSPYVKGLLNTLIEIKDSGVKMNLEFEIDSLFHAYQLDIMKFRQEMEDRMVENSLTSATKLDLIVQSPQLPEYVEEPDVSTKHESPVSKVVSQTIDVRPKEFPHATSSVATPSVATEFSPRPNHQAPTPCSSAGSLDVFNKFNNLNFSDSHGIGTWNGTTMPLMGSNSLYKPNPPCPPTAPQTVMSASLNGLSNEEYVKSLAVPMGELIMSVVRRAETHFEKVVDEHLKIAMETCNSLVLKDFAMNPDEVQYTTAMHKMGSGVFRSYVQTLISIQDIFEVLSTNFLTSVQSGISKLSNTLNAQSLEEAAIRVANEYKQHIYEKAMIFASSRMQEEINKSIQAELERRQKAKAGGQSFIDPSLINQSFMMPESIRVHPGKQSEINMAVYTNFQKMPLPQIGADMPSTSSNGNMRIETPANVRMTRNPNSTKAVQMLLGLSVQIRMSANRLNALVPSNGTNPFFAPAERICALAEQYGYEVGMGNHAKEVAIIESLIQWSGQTLLRVLSQHPVAQRGEYLAPLRGLLIDFLRYIQMDLITDQLYVAKRLLKPFVMETGSHNSSHLFTLASLIRCNLITVQQLDYELSTSITTHPDAPNLTSSQVAKNAYLLAMAIFKDEKDFATIKLQLPNTNLAITSMGSLVQRHVTNESPANYHARSSPLSNCLVTDDMPSFNAEINRPAQPQQGEARKEPHLKKENIMKFMASCVTLLRECQTRREDLTQKFNYLVRQCLFDIIRDVNVCTTFFKIAISHCIDNMYEIYKYTADYASKAQAKKETESEEKFADTMIAVNELVGKSKSECYTIVDTLVHLAVSCVRVNPVQGLVVLETFVQAITDQLHRDNNIHGDAFCSMPYHRTFVTLSGLLVETLPKSSASVHYADETLILYKALQYINPKYATRFAPAWLAIIAHRNFITRMIAYDTNSTLYAQLLKSLFTFIAPFLNLEWGSAVRPLLTGVVRLLLVILQDFPEFLAGYCYQLVVEIPTACHQMRNIILFATPKPESNMILNCTGTGFDQSLFPKLSIPASRVINSSISSTPEILQAYSNIETILCELLDPNAKDADIENLLMVFNNIDPNSQDKLKVYAKLIECLAFEAIRRLQATSKTICMESTPDTPSYSVIRSMIIALKNKKDDERVSILLGCLLDRLRYPNAYTLYFGCVLLHLYQEVFPGGSEVQEQLTALILRRLSVNRPHPWGLQVMFLQLINNAQFWSFDFIVSTPKFGEVLRTVAEKLQPPVNRAVN